ncbi:MAG TPA: LacI family transcriptional regulator [Clostridiales bacterium]|nr:LacI family transcriptional regulator [Clostridiales bacterium]
MVTLKDIAAEAGVSVMTVSRVVNGQFSKVSESNIKKIQSIIEKRGYVPSLSARSLSSHASRIIAVILQGDASAMEYPYNAVLVGQICYMIQDNNYSPMLYYANDYKDITRRLRSWYVEGAVFLGMFDSNLRQIQADNQIPLVFIDSYSSVRQITNVGIDDYKGGELAARYLIEKGHHRVAFVGGYSQVSGVVRQRLNGFRHALEQEGFPLTEECILSDVPEAEVLKKLCHGSEPVTAFFAPADVNALQLIGQLDGLGLRVPEDCSVIGFDDLFFAQYTSPSLTTIRQDIHRKAQIAVDLLFRHIGDPGAPAENITLDVQLVERSSVCDLHEKR